MSDYQSGSSGVFDREAASAIRFRWDGRDWLIVVLFMLFSFLYQDFRRANQAEVINLTGDAANLAAFAAAIDHPKKFASDTLLSDLGNFQFYQTIHIPILRWLADATGSYGNAFTSMLGVHYLLYLAGWYLFGRVLFQDRLLAALLACLLAVRLNTSFGEFWGLYRDALPRVTFSALLGYVFAAAIYWKHTPSAHKWIMAACGALTYTHPVSAPVIACSLWAGFLVPALLERRHVFLLRHGCVIGLAFVLPTIPFAMDYLSVYNASYQADPEAMVHLIQYRFNKDFLNPWPAYGALLFKFTTFGILPLAFLAGRTLWRRADVAHRNNFRIILVWLIGMVLITVVIPLIDTRLFQFMRGVRFLVPIQIIFIVWSLAFLDYRQRVVGLHSVMQRMTPGKAGSLSLVLVVLLLAMKWQGVHWWHKTPQEVVEKQEMIDALRKLTHQDVRILPVGVDPLAIRYGALRSVGHAWKDGGIFLQSNQRAALAWYDTEKMMHRFRQLNTHPQSDQDWEVQVRDLFECILHAVHPDLLVVQKNDFPMFLAEVFRERQKIVWENQSYLLIRIGLSEIDTGCRLQKG
ncbi:MAG: hypothetical protein G8237_02000 [Magnetococcales bacterium]|nr:hypothetical protein [Magnetococcales bacterium]NGZ05106.1 hypothetical protein [Magnetococcales bacterium]